MAKQSHHVVVIGASYGGLPTAHGLLKDVFPKLTDKEYKVTLINPTDEFLWKVATPRTIANPSSIPLEKTLLKFLPTLTPYGDQFSFIQAYATSIDPSTQTVSTSENTSVHYDSLVIASGTSFASDLWSTTAGSAKVKSAYKEVHDVLPTAQAALIAGGGPAGVETAGEFGDVYGKKMDITLLSGSEGLLSRLTNKKIGADAQERLEKMGVKVLNDKIRVSDVKRGTDGKYTVTLTNGEVKVVDIYIDATGDRPNTSFVPSHWLDEKKRVKTDSKTLRLDVEGVKHVYAVGSVATYSDGSIPSIKFSLKPLLYSIQADLQNTDTGARTKNVYSAFQQDMQMVPVGPSGGVGTAFGWRLPSFMVRLAKARDFMIGNAPKLIEGSL